MVAASEYGSSYELEFSEGGGFVLPPAGTYKIAFKGVVSSRDWPKKDDDGNLVYDGEGNQIMETSLWLQFVIDDEEDEYDGTEFRDSFPLKVTRGNKSGRLWAALWGVDVQDLPVPLPKLQEFVNKRCEASLIHNKAKNGNTYLKIGTPTPLRRKKQKAAPVVADDDEDGGF